MAEAALFSLASKLLGVVSSPAFEMAYKRLKSIWGPAKQDLEKLTKTIKTIQAVLLDAEKRQDDSAAVRDWIERVRDVLYEADDLVDDVSTEVLLKQQMRESKVRATFSKLNPIVFNTNIATRVKAIRERLDDIAKDMAHLKFIQSRSEHQQRSGLRVETMPFVDEKVVIGREDEKNAILEFLFDKSDAKKSVTVIAIVGFGGMGKTALAQLVYNHEEVQRNFENKWWACISNIEGEDNVLEKIARSIDKEFHHGSGSDPKELISRSVNSGRSYLLVLDDVKDTDRHIWFGIMALLSSGAKGSKIIVTTRLEPVPRIVHKDNCHVYKLNGLSNDKSWELFRRIAFTKKQETDPRWTNLGWGIMQKCANVPLAIKSIASLLLEKNTIQEWESFNKNYQLLNIELDGNNSIMSTLKLSYDHLPSNLKNCFAYCSLFPQDHRFNKEDLISQWIAQGFVKPDDNETFEEEGHSYFMELFRKSFFQEAMEDEYGEIRGCKMHDLFHDLANAVAGKESFTLITGWNQFSKNARHLYVCCDTDDSSSNIPRSLLDANRLRSCFFKPELSHNHQTLDGLLTKLKLLRSLNLRFQGLKNVPCSIGDLKHLRYLNLSRNKFTFLPDSFTKLVNLLTLDISDCPLLNDLPNDFKKLIKLRHFYNQNYIGTNSPRMHMPAGLEELTCLQRLSVFKVGKKDDSSSRLEVLARMRLKGQLVIAFERGIDNWDEDECWQLPTTLQELRVYYYPGRRIPHWESEFGNGRGHIRPKIPCSVLPNLLTIVIFDSSTVVHLPPFRYLPYLKILKLWRLLGLEYVEEAEDENAIFFPCLEILNLWGLVNLKGWSTTTTQTTTFPLLSELHISKCEGLMSMPLCPRLQTLNGDHMSEELMQQLFSESSCSSLETITFRNIEMLSFPGQALTSIRCLRIYFCNNLKRLNLAPVHLNVLEELNLRHCSELELWEEDSVEWDSLPNLHKLVVNRLPSALPDSLQKLVDGGQLHVYD